MYRHCKIWPTTSKETINTSFQSKKQSIEPYLVVDGVMINHNKGSRTAFFYLSLESVQVVKTFVPRSIKFIHSNLFTSHNFSVGHINFVTFLQLLFQILGGQCRFLLQPMKHLFTHPKLSHPNTSACPPSALTSFMRVWVPLDLQR